MEYRTGSLWEWRHLSRKAGHLSSTGMLHKATPKRNEERTTFRNWARDFVTHVRVWAADVAGLLDPNRRSSFFSCGGCPTPPALLVPTMGHWT